MAEAGNYVITLYNECDELARSDLIILDPARTRLPARRGRGVATRERADALLAFGCARIRWVRSHRSYVTARN